MYNIFMHITRLHVRGFKRFHDLTIELPATPRLVVLAGSNGLGKSSLVDAVRLWHGGHGSGEGWFIEDAYHRRAGDLALAPDQMIEIEFAEEVTPETARKLIYARSAYRHEPDFQINSVSRMGELLNAPRSRRMIDSETKVSDNYQRLVSATLDDLFTGENAAMTVGDLREKHIGRIRNAMLTLFPELELQGPGDPLGGGTFYFKKAGKAEFHYKNLSGGEKAAFDLILDLVVKVSAYDNTVFFIDEPELHLNTRLQASLLALLLSLVPDDGQLWIATHSIGMMRKAQEIAKETPGAVAFLDFEGHNFDEPVSLAPVQPTRDFWVRVLEVALGDLASLVAPDRVVLCEGRPAGNNMNVARAEFDARCYRRIFAAEFPRTDFLSVGNAIDVATDRLELGQAIQTIVSGTKVIRVVDRDMRSAQEIADLTSAGVRVLRRRHLESYLLCDEVIEALCESKDKTPLLTAAINARDEALTASTSRGNDADDFKSAAGDFYVKVRQLLGLVGSGNTTESFLADTLAPLVTPDRAIYAELREDVLGIN